MPPLPSFELIQITIKDSGGFSTSSLIRKERLEEMTLEEKGLIITNLLSELN